MENGLRDLIYRQSMHGVSNGIFALTVAGLFWCGLAAWSADCALAGALPWQGGDVPLRYLAWEPLPALVVTAFLGYGGIRIRRRAKGFRYSELRRVAPESHRVLSRRIARDFLLVSAAEGLACGLLAWLSFRFHREELLWPALGMAISVHFVPLGRIFRVRAYYLTGAAGAVICTIALAAPPAVLSPTGRWLLVGICMCPAMWGTAAWLVLRADDVADAMSRLAAKTR